MLAVSEEDLKKLKAKFKGDHAAYLKTLRKHGARDRKNIENGLPPISNAMRFSYQEEATHALGDALKNGSSKNSFSFFFQKKKDATPLSQKEKQYLYEDYCMTIINFSYAYMHSFSQRIKPFFKKWNDTFEVTDKTKWIEQSTQNQLKLYSKKQKQFFAIADPDKVLQKANKGFADNHMEVNLIEIDIPFQNDLKSISSWTSASFIDKEGVINFYTYKMSIAGVKREKVATILAATPKNNFFISFTRSPQSDTLDTLCFSSLGLPFNNKALFSHELSHKFEQMVDTLWTVDPEAAEKLYGYTEDHHGSFLFMSKFYKSEGTQLSQYNENLKEILANDLQEYIAQLTFEKDYTALSAKNPTVWNGKNTKNILNTLYYFPPPTLP